LVKHLGDYDPTTAIFDKFTTFRPSTGAPFLLAGTPSLVAWKDNSVTSSTAGLSLTASFGGITGSNHYTVDTSADGTFYAAGSFFSIMIAAGTVDSVSVVGAHVGSFTLRKDSALKPTAAARTLDVTATGGAGIDWGNVENPTTVNNLSSTNISTSQTVGTVTLLGNNAIVTGSFFTGALVTGSFFAGSFVTGTFFPGSFVTATFFAGAIDSTVLNATAANEIADAWTARNVAGGSSTGRTNGEAIAFLRNKWTVTSSVLTVFGVDDSTPLWTASVGTNAAAEPIVSSDPS
jgi:hypothetical protein